MTSSKEGDDNRQGNDKRGRQELTSGKMTSGVLSGSCEMTSRSKMTSGSGKMMASSVLSGAK